MSGKNIIVAVLAWIALTLFIAAAATPFAVVDPTTIVASYYFDRIVVKSTVSGASVTTPWSDVKGLCEKFRSETSNALAFAILMTICCGVVAIAAVIRIFKADLISGLVHKILILGFSVATLVFSLIMWAQTFALYSVEYCATSFNKVGGARVGPSAPLALVGFAIAIAMLICEFLMEDNAAAPAASAEQTTTGQAVHVGTQ